MILLSAAALGVFLGVSLYASQALVRAGIKARPSVQVVAALTLWVATLVGIGTLAIWTWQFRPVVLALAITAVSAGQIWWARRLAGGRASLRVMPLARAALATARRHPGYALVTLAVLGIYLFKLVQTLRLPDQSWDGLGYHLYAAGHFVQTHGASRPPLGMYAGVYPANQELLVALGGTFLGTLRYAALVQFMAAALAGSAIFALCRGLGVTRRFSLLAMLAFLSVPIVVTELSTTYNDVFAAGSMLSGLALLWSALGTPDDESPARPQWALLALAGAGLGLGAGAKTTPAPIAVIAVIVALVLIGVRAKDQPNWLRPVLRAGLIVGLPLVALSAGWYARNYLTFGNPFYPVSMLGFPGLDTVDHIHVDPSTPAALKPMGPIQQVFTSWAADFAAPAYSYGMKTGGFGPQWLLLELPALAIATWLWLDGGRHRRPLAVALLVLPVGIGFLVTPTPFRARLTLTFIALGIVAAAYVLSIWRPSIPRLRQAVVAGWCVAIAVFGWLAVDGTLPMLRNGRVADAKQTAQIMTSRYDDRMRQYWPRPRYAPLNRIPKGSVVLATSSRLSMYPAAIIGDDLQRQVEVISTPDTPQHLAEQLRRHDSRYALVDSRATAKPRERALYQLLLTSPQFRPLTSKGRISGGDLFELRG